MVEVVVVVLLLLVVVVICMFTHNSVCEPALCGFFFKCVRVYMCACMQEVF